VRDISRGFQSVQARYNRFLPGAEVRRESGMGREIGGILTDT
jgi:hypothetical protein